MQKLQFPSDFVFGTATASYQVEGAVREDGRTPSIWDVFSEVPGAVYAGESGAVACDHYHRYREDIALMASLGFKSYRFSIAWPRIVPAGRGAVNQKGIDFYRAICDELHAHGMQACATLYHWDLPQSLEDEGGWTVRETALAAGEYSAAVFKNLGGCVDRWITLNEPWCSGFLGYFFGDHAPGRRDLGSAIKAVHHLNLAHALMVKAHHEAGLKTPIGITWNLSTPRPATAKREDVEAALIARAISSEVFTGPVLFGEYPKIVTDMLGANGLGFPVEKGDLELIKAPPDFIGMNYYTENSVSADSASLMKFKTENTWQKMSVMGWNNTPVGLLRQLRWVSEITGGKIPIYVTENGYAADDVLAPDNRVHDYDRIDYVTSHLEACQMAIAEGVPLKGYYAWSFMDNFEWAYGYTKRFGIVYVDYKTLERHPKDSAYFFRDIIAGFGDI